MSNPRYPLHPRIALWTSQHIHGEQLQQHRGPWNPAPPDGLAGSDLLVSDADAMAAGISVFLLRGFREETLARKALAFNLDEVQLGPPTFLGPSPTASAWLFMTASYEARVIIGFTAPLLAVAGAAIAYSSAREPLARAAPHLADRLRPQWRNSAWQVRREAVELTTDPARLATIARTDSEAAVGIAAVDRLNDPSFLQSIACTGQTWQVRKRAYEKLGNAEAALAEVISNADFVRERIEAVADSRFMNQGLLAAIAASDRDEEVRAAAVAKLSDQRVLTQILANERSHRVRMQAVEVLTDQLVLITLATTHREDSGLRLGAVMRLRDQTVLASVARTDPAWSVREAAANRVTDEAQVQALFADTAGKDPDDWMRKAATIALTDQSLLKRLALSAKDRVVRLESVKKLTDQETLVVVARKDTDRGVRITAVTQLTDLAALTTIAKSDTDWNVRRAAFSTLGDAQGALAETAMHAPQWEDSERAVELVKDQSLLAAIAIATVHWRTRMLAIWKSSELSQSVLTEFARNDPNRHVRRAAFERITDPAVSAEIAAAEERRQSESTEND